MKKLLFLLPILAACGCGDDSSSSSRPARRVCGFENHEMVIIKVTGEKGQVLSTYETQPDCKYRIRHSSLKHGMTTDQLYEYELEKIPAPQ